MNESNEYHHYNNNITSNTTSKKRRHDSTTQQQSAASPPRRRRRRRRPAANVARSTSTGRRRAPPSSNADRLGMNPDDVYRPEDSGGLSAHLQLQMRQAAVSRPRTTNELFKCRKHGCDAFINGFAKYVLHVYAHVAEWPFICPQPGCLRVFSSRMGVPQHLGSDHKGEKIVCSLCPGDVSFEGLKVSFSWFYLLLLLFNVFIIL